MARACAIDRVLIADNGKAGPKWFQADATGIYAGYGVMYADPDEVKVAATDATKLVGVADCPTWHDRTAEFEAGQRVPVWMIGSGVEVQMTHDGAIGNASLALEMGDLVARSDSTAGLVELEGEPAAITYGRVTRAVTITDTVAANVRILL